MYSVLEDFFFIQFGKKLIFKYDMFLYCNFNILRILGKNRYGLNKKNLENLIKINKNKNKFVNYICMIQFFFFC